MFGFVKLKFIVKKATVTAVHANNLIRAVRTNIPILINLQGQTCSISVYVIATGLYM